MKTSIGIHLIAAALVLLHRQIGAEITVCSEAGNATCLEENRICLSNDGSEGCGNCTAGFIDFEGRFDVTAGCRNITELPWREFYDNVKPLYRNDTNATIALRLKQLYLALEFVSQRMAQVPPPVFSLGVNKYSADLPEDRAQLAGQRASENASSGFERFVVNRRMLQEIPTEQDWEAKGGTTDVKDQGRCGCCWSISNMGAVEGAAFVTSGFIQSMSFQQLISCDKQNLGCDGGNICYAMDYSVENRFGGLASLNDYPYSDSEGSTTESCETSGKNVSLEVYSPQVVVTYSDTFDQSERIQYLKSATARQPVSVALSSNCKTFSSYRSGVLTEDNDCACQSVSCIDHAVLLVGYNDNNDPPYWKLKNSWGKDWGEGGYFRVSQDGGGRWGLFGILGEGVIALEAFNTTGAEPDDQPSTATSWWAILLYVIAGLIACCCILGVIKSLRRKRRDGPVEQPMDNSNC